MNKYFSKLSASLIATAKGALLISSIVLIAALSPCSAKPLMYSIAFEDKTLPDAMEAIAAKTQTQITLLGDIDAQKLNSVQIEDKSLPEIINTVLNRYRVPNYAIVYDNQARSITIRLVASSSSTEHMFSSTPESEMIQVNGKLTSTHMFSDQDFERLLEKGGTVIQEREFSHEDFKRLQEKADRNVTPDREFSTEDFNNIVSKGTTIKQYPVFSNDDFARLAQRKSPSAEYKLFSDDDFQRVISHQEKALNNTNGSTTNDDLLKKEKKK